MGLIWMACRQASVEPLEGFLGLEPADTSCGSGLLLPPCGKARSGWKLRSGPLFIGAHEGEQRGECRWKLVWKDSLQRCQVSFFVGKRETVLGIMIEPVGGAKVGDPW